MPETHKDLTHDSHTRTPGKEEAHQPQFSTFFLKTSTVLFATPARLTRQISEQDHTLENQHKWPTKETGSDDGMSRKDERHQVPLYG